MPAATTSRRPATAPPVASALAVLLVVAGVLASVLAGCGRGSPGIPREPESSAQQLRVQVLATYPHDESLFTQGLEIHHGLLYESTGLVGESRVRATELPALLRAGSPASPASPTPPAPAAEAPLAPPLFGEGLTVTGERLWQLTWTDGVAVERDPLTLRERRRVSYPGEGWGLCHEAGRLVMSDGSDRLTFRDPDTFAPVGQVAVRLGGEPVDQLNELECAGGVVWANVWRTDQIVRIDPATGAVTAVVDASGLLSPEQQAEADVLNGIAAIPGTDEFLLTGKNWPTLFQVRFVPG